MRVSLCNLSRGCTKLYTEYDMTNIAGNADSMDEIIKEWWTDSITIEHEMKQGAIIIAQYKGQPTRVHKEVVQPSKTGQLDST
jgi:hypothetical protein